MVVSTTQKRELLRQNRKFRAFLLVFFVSSLFLVLQHIDGEQWVTVVGFIYLAYMGGNVGEHWAKKETKDAV
mgnify:CR=1 FL=1